MHDLIANIETGRPVIAANLEELRYLVFHGMTGDPGQSAYELAVELGFEGTESEWLASLHGTNGVNGKDGKNYGIVVDGSVDNILELKSVEVDGGSADAALGENYPPMDDPTANELLDCIYSYIDNSDKLFYGGMNAEYIADCTDPEKVRTDLRGIVDIPSGSTLPQIKDIVDAITDTNTINRIRLALHIIGNHAQDAPMEVVDYLLSGRKPIHCAWFAYLISSGIRYEDSLFAGGDQKPFYDWGFDWAGHDTEGYPHANLLAKYCVDQGYGFVPDSTDFHNLHTGDVVFFANGTNPESFEGIGHVGIFLAHNADRSGCIIAEVDSVNRGDTFPVHISRLNYTSGKMQICTRAARLPYAGAARCGQLKNLFSNEASVRNTDVSIISGGNVDFAAGVPAEDFKQNRFYTFVICLERAASVEDVIGLYAGDAKTPTLFAYGDNKTKTRQDGVYCFPVYCGVYTNGTSHYNHLKKTSGENVDAVYFRESINNGMTHNATVKWIACYEGVHHVGRGGFVPYVSDLTITQQPMDATIAHEGSAVFHVEAQGGGLTFQWQFKTPSGSWRDCTSSTEGYNADTLVVQGDNGYTNRNGYQYCCVVTDVSSNSVTSDAATLTVLPVIPTVDAEPTENSDNAVSSGGVYTALQNAGGLRWEPLDAQTVGADIVLNAGANLASIDKVEAYYCAALGIVRIMVCCTSGSGIAYGSDMNLNLHFDTASKYKPKLEMYTVGSDNFGIAHANINGYTSLKAFVCDVYYDGSFGISIHGVSSVVSPDADVFFHGFYYTEDIPSS